MKSTICTVSGAILIQATPGVVLSNGVPLLPHEAMLIAGELERAARAAERLAANAQPLKVA